MTTKDTSKTSKGVGIQHLLLSLPSLKLVLFNNELAVWSKAAFPDEATLCFVMVPVGIAIGLIIVNLFKNSGLNRGNQKSLLLLVDIFHILATVHILSDQFWAYLLGKTLLGISLGINGAIVPLYIREITSRGAQRNVGKVMGISALLREVLGYFVFRMTYTDYWQIVYGVPLLFALIRIILLISSSDETGTTEDAPKQEKQTEEKSSGKGKKKDNPKNEESIKKPVVKDTGSDDKKKEKTEKPEVGNRVYIESYIEELKISLILLSVLYFLGIHTLDAFSNLILTAPFLTLALGFIRPAYSTQDLRPFGCTLVEVINNIIGHLCNFALPLCLAASSQGYSNGLYIIGGLSLLNLLNIVAFFPSASSVSGLSRTLNHLSQKDNKRKLNQQIQSQEKEPAPKESASTTNFSMTPIGFIENGCYPDKFGVPRQPKLAPHSYAILRLNPPYDHPDSIRGLEDFSHVWVTFVFHQSPDKWTPLIRPPRLGGNAKVGVFGSRSTHRPNRLGLSLVEIVKIETDKGIKLHLKGHDLVNGTPVLDIKPYIPWGDLAENARAGFAPAPPEQLPVKFLPEAEQVLKGRKDRQLLEPLIREVMSQDPRPAYKSEDAERRFGVYLDDLDVRFKVLEENGKKVVNVVEIVKSHFAKENQ